MTLEEAAKIHANKYDYSQAIQEAAEYDFKAGARWYQANHSCCCAGCGQHNFNLVTPDKTTDELARDE